ncbi:deoxyribonucleoside regulator [Companilactobacillus sp. RD055328]|uniref:sugar-binding transcriptional regulator n=1 Tax=Companilactobacillus sp. RD055328 TaxID=2916634 RepID=UPI001FC8CFBC|nr:sugar-binding transcriptional regulator [Companilactobacillus sp. RD055328]GKQ42382.1 deoxyribonucleoside regulator [Companilactobacillus sp. RD055328]
MDDLFDKKIRQSIKAAHLYYESEYSQEKIAKELNVSRPTVVRLLQYAKESGIVKVVISDPCERIQQLEEEIKSKYKLSKVKVVPTPNNNYDDIVNKLGEDAADLLESIVEDEDIIGVSWGQTMNAVAKHLRPQSVKNVEIVELKGNVTYTTAPIYAETVLMEFGKAFNTSPYKLPLPVIFENQETHDLVLQERYINSLIKKGKDSNIALFTVGTVRDKALLFKTGYFTEKEINYLKENSTGDICSRFFTSDGSIAWPQLDNRTVAIQLNDLKTKKYSILIAGGQHKVRPIKAALSGGYANVLVIDEQTAKSIVD